MTRRSCDQGGRSYSHTGLKPEPGGGTAERRSQPGPMRSSGLETPHCRQSGSQGRATLRGGERQVTPGVTSTLRETGHTGGHLNAVRQVTPGVPSTL